MITPSNPTTSVYQYPLTPEQCITNINTSDIRIIPNTTTGTNYIGPGILQQILNNPTTIINDLNDLRDYEFNIVNGQMTFTPKKKISDEEMAMYSEKLSKVFKNIFGSDISEQVLSKDKSEQL
jgi:hypothetical protein